jgi:multidrug efflux pump subunit AcrA (membrane-fusion protein)
VAAGQTIELWLDAYPGQTWEAVVEKVQPRSEIRDEDNVFIAEAELDNTDGRLRPGMKGRAKVETRHRPLGWILFHKPWEYITKHLSW